MVCFCILSENFTCVHTHTNRHARIDMHTNIPHNTHMHRIIIHIHKTYHTHVHITQNQHACIYIHPHILHTATQMHIYACIHKCLTHILMHTYITHLQLHSLHLPNLLTCVCNVVGCKLTCVCTLTYVDLFLMEQVLNITSVNSFCSNRNLVKLVLLLPHPREADASKAEVGHDPRGFLAMVPLLLKT